MTPGLVRKPPIAGEPLDAGEPGRVHRGVRSVVADGENLVSKRSLRYGNLDRLTDLAAQ